MIEIDHIGKLVCETLPERFICQSPRVAEALELAGQVHENDVRKDGTPYISHCVAVADILRYLGADEEVVIAGLLHDTVEDHPDKINFDYLKLRFGERVARIVFGSTKFTLSTGEFGTDFQTLRKQAREAPLEIGVVLVKCADRLHNLMTIGPDITEASRREKAMETLKFYVPLAVSFGLWDLAKLLADRAFMYTEPEKYAEVSKQLIDDPRNEPEFKKRLEAELSSLLSSKGLTVRVKAWCGGIFELFEKRRTLAREEAASPNDFRDISSLVTFRVVVENEEQIYLAEAYIRQKFGRLIGETVKDYVAKPSDNGYRALHLTRMTEVGQVKISLATEEMENFNHYGVLSLVWRGEEKSFQPPILVFTRRGDLVFMRPGSRVVDLAWELNPILGLEMIGANIDNVLVSPETELTSGDMVEIIPANKIVVEPIFGDTSVCRPETRAKIDRQIGYAERQRKVKEGKLILEKILSKYGLLNISDLDEVTKMGILTALTCRHSDDLCFKLGYGHSYVEEVERVLSESRFFLDKRGYTTVIINGKKNQKGLAIPLRELIYNFGGDVIKGVERVDPTDGSFLIRLVLLGIAADGKEALRLAISERKVFGEVVVV